MQTAGTNHIPPSGIFDQIPVRRRVPGEGHEYGGKLGITYRTNYSVAVRFY